MNHRVRLGAPLMPQYHYSIIPRNIGKITASPIQRINTRAHITMKTRIRPIPHTFYPAMFNRIEMNIVYMTIHIFLVQNLPHPKTPLPDTTLSPHFPTGIHKLTCCNTAGELRF